MQDQYGMMNISTKICMTVNCDNLPKLDIGSKSDPIVVVFEFNPRDGKWIEFGRTEVIENNHNPRFLKQFIVDYFFECNQQFRFQVFDYDKKSKKYEDQDEIGQTICTLGELVASKGGAKTFTLMNSKKPNRNNGTITVATEQINPIRNEQLTYGFQGKHLDKKDTFGKSDPYMKIYRAKDNDWNKVYETEVIKNTLDPKWNPMVISLARLCNGDRSRRIKFEVFDWDKVGEHDLIGVFTTTVAEMQLGKSFAIINDKIKHKKGSKYTNSGEIFITRFESLPEFNFIDYVQGMLEINMMVGIDFTASNGNPTDPKSLHYMDPNSPNQYIRALEAIIPIVSYYDHDKKYPCYGFGALVKKSTTANHCFSLNMQDNPECFELGGVIQAYKESMSNIELYGPTNFAPLIKQAVNTCKMNPCTQQVQKYLILLILTDGEITDMEETKREIVEASFHPMSIIIIGVGDADFSKMQFLDGDDHLLKAGGKTAARDIVQFVPFRDFKNKHISELAKCTLAEIPNQVKQFMMYNKFVPNPRPQFQFTYMPPQQGQFPPQTGQQFPPQQGQQPPQQFPPQTGQQFPPQQTGQIPPQQQGQQPPQQTGQQFPPQQFPPQTGQQFPPQQTGQIPPQQQGQQPPQQTGQQPPQQWQGQWQQQPPQQWQQQYYPPQQGQWQQPPPQQWQGQWQQPPQQQGQQGLQTQQQPPQQQGQQTQDPQQQPPQQTGQQPPQQWQGQWQQQPPQQWQQQQYYPPQQGQWQQPPPQQWQGQQGLQTQQQPPQQQGQQTQDPQQPPQGK